MNHEKSINSIARNHKLAAWVCEKMLRAPLTISGQENISTDNPSLVVATHLLGPPDIPAFGRAWIETTGRPLRILYKAEYDNNPYLRRLFRSLGAMAVNRKQDGTRAGNEQIGLIVEALRQGQDIGIFGSGEQNFYHDIPIYEEGPLFFATSKALKDTVVNFHNVGIFGAKPYIKPNGDNQQMVLKASVASLRQPIHVHLNPRLDVSGYDRKDAVSGDYYSGVVQQDATDAYDSAAGHWRKLHA